MKHAALRSGWGPAGLRRWGAAGLNTGLVAGVALGLGVALTAAGWAGSAAAQTAAAPSRDNTPPAEVRSALASPVLQGQGALRFMGLRVYEALLWAPAGQPVAAAQWAQPLALEIRYQRGLKGKLIAERSLKEMERQGDVDNATAQRWLQAMEGLFPDVEDGSRITGVHLPGEGARFYSNGRLLGPVNDAEFARRFFGIWLSPQSSEPKLRLALLGPGAAPAKP